MTRAPEVLPSGVADRRRRGGGYVGPRPAPVARLPGSFHPIVIFEPFPFTIVEDRTDDSKTQSVDRCDSALGGHPAGPRTDTTQCDSDRVGPAERSGILARLAEPSRPGASGEARPDPPAVRGRARPSGIEASPLGQPGVDRRRIAVGGVPAPVPSGSPAWVGSHSSSNPGSTTVATGLRVHYGVTDGEQAQVVSAGVGSDSSMPVPSMRASRHSNGQYRPRALPGGSVGLPGSVDGLGPDEFLVAGRRQTVPGRGLIGGRGLVLRRLLVLWQRRFLLLRLRFLLLRLRFLQLR